MARPQEYTDDIVVRAKEYIDSCSDTHYEVKKKPKIKDGVYNGEDEDVVIKKTKLPTIEGLALYLGIHRDTIYDWESQDDKSKFSDIISELRQKQADMLINNGLTGAYSPVISKVLLTKHGYRDSQEVTGKDGKDLIPDIQALQKAETAIDSYLNK